MRKEGGAETWQSSSCYHLPDAPLCESSLGYILLGDVFLFMKNNGSLF